MAKKKQDLDLQEIRYVQLMHRVDPSKALQSLSAPDGTVKNPDNIIARVTQSLKENLKTKPNLLGDRMSEVR